MTVGQLPVLGAQDEAQVCEAKLIVNGQEFMLRPGEVLTLEQGNKVQIFLKLSKPPETGSVVWVSSDLLSPEGLPRFRSEDYPIESSISMKFSGIIPVALVKEGSVARIGERPFTLVNLMIEKDGFAKTLLSVTAVATTSDLETSKAKINESEALLQLASGDDRSRLARDIVKAAATAREAGNPSLAITLCDAAQQALNLKLEVVDLPFWYLMVMFVLILSLVGIMVFLLNQSKKGQAAGWIRPR